jgi:hypothetical protein
MNNYSSVRKLGLGILSTVILLLMVLSIPGCLAPNHVPEIVSLEAGEMVIGPSESCIIECMAWDQDGDVLTYNWTAEVGTITKMNKVGNSVAWMATKEEGVYVVTVEVSDGKGAGGPKSTGSLEIMVKNNHAPVITGLTTDKEWVMLSGSCQFNISAEDEDGDELQYEWVVDGGEISGTGQSVIWKAPDITGLYQIKGIANDGFGKEDVRIISISVSQNPPPEIVEVRVTPAEPAYYREENGRYIILRDRQCTIECVVADAYEGLTYEWSDGEDTYTAPDCCGKTAFSGEGSTITWTAPGKATDVIISVYVYDELGNAASRNLSFKVESCSCAF